MNVGLTAVVGEPAERMPSARSPGNVRFYLGIADGDV